MPQFRIVMQRQVRRLYNEGDLMSPKVLSVEARDIDYRGATVVSAPGQLAPDDEGGEA